MSRSKQNQFSKEHPRIYATRKDIQGKPAEDDVIISESLGFCISLTARMLARTLKEALAPYDVAPAQWTTLLHLWSKEGIAQRELSRAVGIEEATLTRTIDRLVRDELVVRQKDPDSGRRHKIMLTAKGRRMKQRLVPVVRSLNQQALRNLTPDEFATLIQLLARVRSGLEQEAPFKKG